MTKNILYTNEMFPVRLVFLIDVLLTGASFVASYLLCSLILPDIGNHGMLIQLPIIVALTSLIFLFIGIYKGYVKYDKVREVYSIFNAICITNILTIILVVVNGKLFMEKELMVPLSIIIVHSILSFSALVVSRYLYKYLTARGNKKGFTQGEALFLSDLEMENRKIKTIFSLLEKDFVNGSITVKKSSHFLNADANADSEVLSKVDCFYLHVTMAHDNPQFLKLLNSISDLEKPIYLVDVKKERGEDSKSELVITKVTSSELFRSEKKAKNNLRQKKIGNPLTPVSKDSTIEHQTA